MVDAALPAARRATAALDRLEPVPPPLAAELLREVLDELPRLVPRQHPLGFLHIDLSGAADVPGLRLHVWTDEFTRRADPLGRLHDHTWELRSAVLVGRLVDHVLEARPDVNGRWHAHRVSYASGGNSLEPVLGNWTLHETAARDVSAGQSYGLPPRRVHRTEVLAEPTATLVHAVSDGGPGLGPIVYAPPGLVAADAAPRPQVRPRAAGAAIEQALSVLAAAGCISTFHGSRRPPGHRAAQVAVRMSGWPDRLDRDVRPKRWSSGRRDGGP
jgi:hypothetical protein